MATRFNLSIGLCSLALLAASATLSAQVPGATDGKQSRLVAASKAATDQASPKERGELTRKFVNKWGPYVQRVYGVPVGVWAKRMVPNFVTTDSSNFRNALKRDTYEGAMAELTGTGHRLSDDSIITKLALIDAEPGDGASRVVTRTLGALTNDLVYTPVQPCRILDTRSTAAGAIAANSTRSFIAAGTSSYTSQGGSATNCGMFSVVPTAVAINLTAVTPTAAGFATAFPYSTTQPLAASVNYASGAIVNNAVIVQVPNPIASFDFTVYTFAQSHYVADIVGYFAPPVATALQCIETANENLDIAGNGGTGNAVAPACAAGYTQTATNCETTSWLMPIVFFQSGTCSARNGDTATRTLRASRTCCRVPGR
jgi:hypothetical protein